MKTKLIFSPQLAQWLLHSGYTIVELKPKRDCENETVFFFKEEEGFYDAMTRWSEEKEYGGYERNNQ